MRTDEEIVSQTNALATQLSAYFGYVVPDGNRFDQEGMSRLTRAWDMACKAQEIITDTDPEDAVSGMEEDDYVANADVTISIKSRSAKEIVEQTNRLADEILNIIGYEAPEGYLHYESDNLRAETVWQAASLCQEFLTQTDVHDALIEFEEDQREAQPEGVQLIVTPKKILELLGFDVPEEGVVIDSNELDLHLESLKALGQTMSIKAIPKETIKHIAESASRENSQLENAPRSTIKRLISSRMSETFGLSKKDLTKSSGPSYKLR